MGFQQPEGLARNSVPMGVTTDVADSTSVPKLERKKLQDDLGIMFESGPLNDSSQIVKCQILNHEP